MRTKTPNVSSNCVLLLSPAPPSRSMKAPRGYVEGQEGKIGEGKCSLAAMERTKPRSKQVPPLDLHSLSHWNPTQCSLPFTMTGIMVSTLTKLWPFFLKLTTSS